jgi:hypothetical protein
MSYLHSSAIGLTMSCCANREVPEAGEADQVRRRDAQSNARSAAAERQKGKAESLAEEAEQKLTCVFTLAGL